MRRVFELGQRDFPGVGEPIFWKPAFLVIRMIGRSNADFSKQKQSIVIGDKYEFQGMGDL
jgi:hypothetical protein